MDNQPKKRVPPERNPFQNLKKKCIMNKTLLNIKSYTELRKENLSHYILRSRTKLICESSLTHNQKKGPLLIGTPFKPFYWIFI
jgi:hypothetical protein